MPAATARWTHAGSNTAANTAQQTHCSKRTAANTPQQTHRSKHTAANTPQQSAGCACCVQHRSCACHGKQHSLGHPASPPVIITRKQTPRDTRRVLWRSSAVAPHCMQAPQCMQSYVAIRVPAFLTPYEYNIQSCLAGRHASAAAAATCPHLRARASAARGDAPLVDLAMPKVAAPRDGAAMGAPAWAAAHRGGAVTTIGTSWCHSVLDWDPPKRNKHAPKRNEHAPKRHVGRCMTRNRTCFSLHHEVCGGAAPGFPDPRGLRD